MLSIKNLSHTYPNGVKALNNLNLEVPKGMFGLLGPNGAGKSSLMRTISTLQQPTEGSITFGGVDVLKEPDALRRVLGYLPQDFGVYPRTSAYDMLDHMAVLKGITNKKERKEVVEGLLNQTNLFAARKKNLSTYSGGMRQRFGIAQALIGDPQLIIVDEPTAGLDPEERNRFHNLLAEIGENVVVILSTHIVEDVADLCPNMVIINSGTIVAGGKPGDLIASLNGKIWKKAIKRTEVDAFKESHAVISSRLVAGDTVIRVLSEGEPTGGFEQVEADLEDVYFSKLYESRIGNAGATPASAAA
ncbi:ABC transporter ATP-binding protein [Kordiimonas sp. SCSIO 12603]|uniref:ABC transporter ATP-binding protein n=1 Tax=Kordiimonas sp. SCSIO 12603 TaxID=2829596 RepID=UPI002106ED0D|nr:ABC transporter ATP-binding protein [Kordiimonas sp. SCSIO 12603]UTW59426.1 ABC transporter ATP-binding protein [Kordiimonas sp. SCSIO 12603]